MSNKRSLKNQILLTTTLVGAALASYGRRAYAACVNTGGMTYLCSGANASGQYINANNASVSTAAGFSVNSTTRTAIQITGDGTLSFTDNNASTISTSAAYTEGLYIRNSGNTPGSITITTGAGTHINGAFGIFADNYAAGALTITTDGTVTGTGTAIIAVANGNGTTVINTGNDSHIDGGGIGILASGYGLTITVDGEVSSTTGNSRVAAVYATNHGTGDSLITTGINSHVTGHYDGIFDANYSTGNMTININGTVAASVRYGVYADNQGADLTITTGVSSSITGANGRTAMKISNYGSGIGTITINGTVTGATGVNAINRNQGATTVTANGDVTGTNGYGIQAFSYYNNLTVITGVGSNITGSQTGISARESGGTGSLTVTANGDVSSTQSNGIYASNYYHAGSDLNITTGLGSQISGRTNGIEASNTGTGATTITANGTVTGGTDGVKVQNGRVNTGYYYNSNPTPAYPNGHYVAPYSGLHYVTGASGYGTNMVVTTGAGSSITGGTNGIEARNYGSGFLSVTVNGDVTGSNGDGVLAFNGGHTIYNGTPYNFHYGTNLIITQGSASHITGSSYGIYAWNNGSGYLNITTNGHVTGTNSKGIYAFNSSSSASLTITTGIGSVVTGNFLGIAANNYGSGALTITANGDVTSGDVGIYARNNSGTNIVLTTGVNSVITGTYQAISAYNDSSNGGVSITINGVVTSPNGNAIGTFTSTGGTYLTLTTGVDSMISGVLGGIYVRAYGNGALSIMNAGDVTGPIGITIGHDYATGGTITNASTGTIEGTGGTAISLQNLAGPTSVVINGGHIIGDIVDNAPAAGHSTVEFAHNFVTQGGTDVSHVVVDSGVALTISSGDTLTTRDMTTNGGTLTFGVYSAASHGGIVITNGALTLSGETIAVSVDANDQLMAGEKILIADGSSALVGGPGATPLIVSDNSSSFNFAVVNGVGAGMGTADDLYLEVLALITDTTISTATTTPITLNAGDSLHVTDTGTIVVGAGSAVSTTAAANLIDNAGLIQGPTGVSITGGSISSMINEATGTITGTNGTAIALSGLTGVVPITINGGHIIGNVTDANAAAGHSSVEVAGDFTTQGNFTVSNFTIDAAKILTLGSGNNIASQSSALTDNGTLVSAADGSSSLMGGLTVGATGAFAARSNTNITGALTNDGNTAVQAGAILTATTMAAAASPGTLTFGVTSTTNHGELVVTGGAANLTNQSIAVDVSNNASLLGGDRILVVQGVNALIGGPGNTPAVVADNSALYTFALVDGTGSGVAGADADQAYLEVSLSSPAMIADTPNNAGAATALANAGTSSPQLAHIQENLNNAPTAAAVNDILSSVTPTVDGSAPVAAANVSSNTFELEAVRLADLQDGDTSGDYDGTGMTAGDAMQGVGMWGQGFGAHANQDARNGIAGYHANTFGGAAGIDTRNIADNAILGVAFSYGNTEATSRNANSTKTETDSYQLSLYGDYDFSHNSYLDGLLGYSWNDVDTTRHHVGGLPGLSAQGNFDASQFSGQAELGHHYIVQTGNLPTVLTPNLLVSGIHYDPQSYTETGAGGADLHVDGKSMDLVQIGAGLKAGWEVRNLDVGALKPELGIGYRYTVVNDRLEDNVDFQGGGTSFQARGPTPARSSLDLQASLALITTGNWTLSAQYNLELRSDYTDNQGTVRAAYRF